MENNFGPNDCQNCILVSHYNEAAVKQLVVAVSDLVDKHSGHDDIALIEALEDFAWDVLLLIDGRMPQKFAF